MNVLVIGDVVGSPGRAILKKGLPLVFRKHDIDYCIANVENAAGGFGVTKEVCDELLDLGIDCMTSGNHIWDKKEIIGMVDLIPQLLRPLNYPEGQPGRGSHVGKGEALGRARGHSEPQLSGVHERSPRRPLPEGRGGDRAAA
jgi:calcineurin-like phosphoesterase